ncbi:hypothetical protein I4U23_006904 [Adineta vaga]|nr:hypothetical protein I4U23_006904 [Adineta vaga]
MPASYSFVAIFLSLSIIFVNGSHFLGGTINWRIQNSSTGSSSIGILITQTYSWTYVVGRCDGNATVTNQPVAGSGGTLTCSPSCPTGFTSVSATPDCTDLSVLNGIAVGQRSDIVYIPENSVFSAIYADSAWGTLALGGTNWAIASKINLVRRSDNNMFNNAPVATIMSPVNLEVNQKTWITLSVSDADGDIIRCRWAGLVNGVDECSSVCPPGALPANTTIYSNCTIEITGTIIGKRYAVVLMAEDFINSASTTPLSSVPVQFIVEVISPTSCPTPPETILAGSSCTPVKVNEVFRSTLLGFNYCGENITIVDIATLSFAENGTDTCPEAGSNITVVLSTTTATTESTTTSTTTTTVSRVAVTQQSNCINWPLVASLAALALAALACNLCLLCHVFKCCHSVTRRRQSQYDKSKDLISMMRTSKIESPHVLNESVYTIQNESINELNNHQTHSNITKNTNKKQSKVITVSPYRPRQLMKVSSYESDVNDQPINGNHPLSTIPPQNLKTNENRSNVHVTKIKKNQSKSISNHVSPKKTKTTNIAHVKICSHDYIPVKNMNTMKTDDLPDSSKKQIENKLQTKTGQSTSSNVTVAYVP